MSRGRRLCLSSAKPRGRIVAACVPGRGRCCPGPSSGDRPALPCRPGSRLRERDHLRVTGCTAESWCSGRAQARRARGHRRGLWPCDCASLPGAAVPGVASPWVCPRPCTELAFYFFWCLYCFLKIETTNPESFDPFEIYFKSWDDLFICKVLLILSWDARRKFSVMSIIDINVPTQSSLPFF